jgi:hypothetical protein
MQYFETVTHRLCGGAYSLEGQGFPSREVPNTILTKPNFKVITQSLCFSSSGRHDHNRFLSTYFGDASNKKSSARLCHYYFSAFAAK